MYDRIANRLPAILVILALISPGAPAMADKEPAESQETTGEQHAESPRNHLRWSTATEQENFGYDIYRAESEDGPFERINSDPILGAGTSDEPSSYEYVDDDVDPYKTYWYYLESISMGGVKERFTPVFRKQAKLSPSGPETGTEEGAGDPRPD